MSNAAEILAQYSQELPTKLTPAIKKAIIAAISPNFTQEQVMQKVLTTNWSNKQAIQDLCRAKLASILTIKRDSSIEHMEIQLASKAAASIQRQLEKQENAIASHLIQRISSISYHTLIHKLAKRTSKAEYKFQTSRTPLFEDKEAIMHYVIEPFESTKGEAKNRASYPLVVDYSVYDPTHIPIELLDLMLSWKMKHKYSESQELQLRIEAADREEDIKQSLLNAKPLGFPYKAGGAPDYTQRILSLFFQWRKVWYLLSENTPLAYEEKERKQYMNNIIRYEVFTHRKLLIAHLEEEIPYVMQKRDIWRPLLEKLKYFQKKGLKNVYENQEHMSSYKEMIDSLKEKTVWLTLLEQKLRQSLDRIHMKHAHNDQIVINSMVRLVKEWIAKQDEKLNAMKLHIEALKQDPDF